MELHDVPDKQTASLVTHLFHNSQNISPKPRERIPMTKLTVNKPVNVNVRVLWKIIYQASPHPGPDSDSDVKQTQT